MPVKKSVGWKEIDEVIADCTTAQESGKTDFPERSYEEGVMTGIKWVTGLVDDEHPLDKEE